MSTNEPLYIKRHDLQPYYYGAVQNNSGDLVDISSVTMYASMRDERTGTMVFSHQTSGCYVTSGPGGAFQYQWQASDTALSGRYSMEFEFVPAVGGKFSVPADPDEEARVIILDDLDGG